MNIPDDSPRARVAAAARFAARHCTRWRELLASWTLADELGEGGSGELPIVDRNDLFGSGRLGSATRRSPKELVVDGSLAPLGQILASSGSSGSARAWTGMTRASCSANVERLSLALAELWGLAGDRSVLVINALPPGPTFDLPSALVVHTGPEPELISEFLSSWAPEYDATVLVGEPWPVKAALEHAHERGVELARLDLRVALGGELLPEPLRDYLAALIGVDLDRAGPRILASMGCSEVGLQLAWETPATVALRRALTDDPAALASICGAGITSAPCFMTWDPSSIFVEFIAGQLILTCLDLERAVPLIRYRLGDRGGFVVDRARAQALVDAQRPELSLPESLLFITGREGPALLASLADAVSACHDALPHLSGGFYLDVDVDALVVQLVRDDLPAGLVDDLHARLERELRAHLPRAAHTSLELRPRSAYPHTSNLYTSKFQRSIR